jgi:dTDP-4-amino-4,6-dideoxygalactose transaminase
LQLNKINKTQQEVYGALREAGILVNLHYIPVYRQPYYEKMGFSSGYCSQAESYYSEAISIPLYPGLTEEQQKRVVTEIRKGVGL